MGPWPNSRPGRARPLCFSTVDQHEPYCSAPAECRAQVDAAAAELFDRIHGLAETGDPYWVKRAEQIATPADVFTVDLGLLALC